MTEFSNKSRSVLILAILLLSPIAFLAYVPSAHAASPSITLSASTGPGAGKMSGILVTGTGFPQLSTYPSNAVELCFESTSKTLSAAGCNQVLMYGQTLNQCPAGSPPACGTAASATANEATVDANGNFQAYIDTPHLPGDTYNVFGIYTPSQGSQTITAPVTFVQTPYMDIRVANDLACANTINCDVAPKTTSVHWGQWVRIQIFSFGNAETVTVTGAPVPSGSTIQLTTDANGDSYVSSGGTLHGVTGNLYVHIIGESVGGTKTVTAVGGTSGLTFSKSITIIPGIEVFTQSGASTLSVPATAPASVGLALHGFANAETISAATVGGYAATFGAVTTNSDGSFGVGGLNHLSLLYTTSLPFTAVSISLTGSKTGSVTFNAKNGNVVNPFGAWPKPVGGPVTDTDKSELLSATAANNANYVGAYTLDLTASGGGVPIVASTKQASGTSIIAFSESAGHVGDTVGVYLTGWNSGITVVVSPTASSGISYNATPIAGCASGVAATLASTTKPFCTVGANSLVTDANGAGIATIVIPASFRGSQTVLVTISGGGSSATNPGTTFTVTPLLLFYTGDSADDNVGMVAFTNSCAAVPAPAANAISTYGCVMVTGTGFGTATTPNTETLSLTIGTTVVSSTFISAATQTTNTGGFGAIQVIQATGLPDLAAGTYAVVATGATSGDNATGYDYYSWNSLGITTTALTVVSSWELGSALSPLPGAAVTPGKAVVVVSTSTAGIHGLAANTKYSVYMDGPSGTHLTDFTSTGTGQVAPGTQFTVPTGTSGVHIIDFVQNGASVVLGKTVNVQEDDVFDESTYSSIFIQLSGSITVTPSAGTAGSTVTLSGSGLSASTAYTVEIDTTLGLLATQCNQGVGGCVSYTSFTSATSGAIPSGVSFVFPAVAIGAAGCGACTETGTTVTVSLYNTATNKVDSTGTFLLQAGASVAPTTQAPGGQVKFSANGLLASQGYNIVWNAGVTSNGGITGLVVGSFISGTDGTGLANFTVPASASPGTYSIQLLRVGIAIGSPVSNYILVSTPSVTAGVGVSGALKGTATFSVSGTISQVTIQSTPALQVSYTNNLNSAVTGIVYAVVHNAAGQTVYYTTSTITPAAGATVTAYLVLAGLPSGSYSVTIFVVTPGGISISTTSTATASL